MNAFCVITHRLIEIQNALAEICATHSVGVAADLADAAAYLKDPVGNAAKRGAWLRFMTVISAAPKIGGLKMQEQQLIQLLHQILQKNGGVQAATTHIAANAGILPHIDAAEHHPAEPLYEPG